MTQLRDEVKQDQRRARLLSREQPQQLELDPEPRTAQEPASSGQALSLALGAVSLGHSLGKARSR